MKQQITWFVTFFLLVNLLWSRQLLANEPILSKTFPTGLTVLFEKNKFVDQVTVYQLIDKTSLLQPFVIEKYLTELEVSLSALGATCQTYSLKPIPELPWNLKDQAFFIARFTSVNFEQNLVTILRAFLHFNSKARYLLSDQNIIFQQRKKQVKFLQPDSFLSTMQEWRKLKLDPVTLQKHTYLLFSGKISVFSILTSLNLLLTDQVETESKDKLVIDQQRYWLLVFQKFLVDQIKHSFSEKNPVNCVQIFAPVDFKNTKIHIWSSETKFFSGKLLLSLIRGQKEKFQKWYFTDYLNYFNWFYFNKDVRALFRLYSECYLNGDAFFNINLNIDNQYVDQFFNEPEMFIEYHEND